jgi:uncharacterized protein YbbC (DUF1343 family)
MNKGKDFFNDYFDKLAGGPALRNQILAGVSADEIRAGWKGPLDAFMQKRSRYLLYPDFTR